MHTKQEIVNNWLVRYTSRELSEFPPYILLTNFNDYVERFARLMGTEVRMCNMPNAMTSELAMINFGMGSPNAATIMDLLMAVKPRAVLFLGKCGGVKRKNQLGDFILPIAAIRADGTSNDYLPPEVPALPAFQLQRVVSGAIRDHGRDYWTGTVFSTNRRVWEHDEEFKHRLEVDRVMAVDMETATLFTVGFHNEIPTGALLLVSDQPMTPDGIKTAESDRHVTAEFVDAQIAVGIEALGALRQGSKSVKHLRF